MEQNLSMEISCHYFARLDGYSEEIFNTDRIITVDGVEYIWTIRVPIILVDVHHLIMEMYPLH